MLRCVVTTLVACDPAQSKIDELEKLVMEVEQDYSSYTREDWRGVSEAYDALIAEMDKYEYSTEDRKRIGRLKGEYEAVVLKYTMTNITDIVSDYAEETKEGINGFIDGMTKELEDSSEVK